MASGKYDGAIWTQGSPQVEEIVYGKDGLLEAARAGEHGSGFGLIAHKISALAEDVASATRDIRSLVLEASSEHGASFRLSLPVSGRAETVTAPVASWSPVSSEWLHSVRKVCLPASGEAAQLLLENPTRFLSTVQVGITSIGMLNGILGEAAFSEGVADWLRALGVAHRAAEISATALVVTLITFITIVFGELVPKRIGQLYPEAVSRRLSRPMAWLARAAGPFVKLLSATTQAILGLMGVRDTGSRGVTEEEIAASLEEGLDAGVIEQQVARTTVLRVVHRDGQSGRT